MKPSVILTKLGFESSQQIEGRASVADLFKPKRRCGVYVLHFANGEYYVGQAVDVVRRHGQHRQVHSDISEISFRRAPLDELDELEQEGIADMESHGLRLRNITFTSIPPVEADFDIIMPKTAQVRWLQDPSYNFHGQSRPVDVAQRRRYESKFKLLTSKVHFEECCSFLRAYARSCLPALHSAEVSFWALSCLPQPQIYTRVNIGWQEVLTVGMWEPQLGFSFHVALTALKQGLSESLDRFARKNPTLEFFDHQYKPGGADQIALQLFDPLVAAKLIQHPVVLNSIRHFNWRLMKKGPCAYGRHHCPQLADLVAG